jgi:hypothetical protein
MTRRRIEVNMVDGVCSTIRLWVMMMVELN